jgi:ketosteroid isomerase-like protein
MDAFRKAVEAGDAAALLATLAPDVRFNSPAVFKPYQGRDSVAPLLHAVMAVLAPTLRYQWEAIDGDRHILGFTAHVADKDVEGVDILVVGDDGLIHDFTVMVRPLSGLSALRDAIGAQLTG